MEKRSYPLLLFLCLVFNIQGQQLTPIRFRSITINDGLSQGFVSSILQDKQGMMWFGTGDGLNKYDGYSFSVFHHDADDPTTIGSDDIVSVYEDSKKRLWICTRNNGADLFDREQNTFYHFRHSEKESIRSDRVTSISEDKSGALWIRTDEGVDRLEIIPVTDQATKNKKDFWASNKIRITHIKLPTGPDKKEMYGSIFNDSRGHSYFFTSKEIFEFKFKTYDNYSLQKVAGDLAKSTKPFLPGMLEDTASYSLFLNDENLIRYPSYDFKLPHIIHNYKEIGVSVWTIDKDQMIWLINDTGLVRISITNGEKWYYACADAGQIEAFQTATCLYVDRQGIVWIGTGGYGILKYDPEKELFHHILPGTIHYQILELKPGELITNSFKRVELDKNLRPSFPEDEFFNFLQAKFLHSNIIFFSKDTSGNLWIPEGRNIHFYNVHTKQQRTFQISIDGVLESAYPLYMDKQDMLWFGARKNFVQSNNQIDILSRTPYPSNQTIIEYDFLQGIYEDGAVLWLGSVNGLFKYDIKSQQIIQSYFFHAQDSSSLSNNFVFSFCNDIKDPDRYLWVGTKGGGINKLDKLTGKFTRFTNKNGLANNVVYGILPGDDGNLWLSTNGGLSAFNPETKIFRNYDSDDGLQSNEFNRYAYCKTSEGVLVFGGMNGINYFDPKSILPLEPPDVIFTDFRLFNKPVNLHEPNAPIKRNINYEQTVHLRYTQNVVTLQFAAMDYRRSGNIKYRYKMEGFDKDWIYATTSHEATYTNLDPGDYNFTVQASFENNNWGEKKRSIHLTVVPPWYRTWLFYITTTVTIGAAIYGLYRFRLYQLKRLEKLRNSIARDLHDEVGSSISTIAIYSKIMHEQVDSIDFDNQPLITKINVFASEIMESMNDIVWNINTKNDAFDRIISRMREHAVQLLEARNYDVHFDFDEGLNKLKLNMEKRREFYLVYKEALNNIIKYANGSNVWISMKLQHNTIRLLIKDDGKGFELDKTRAGGNGLANMRHRSGTLHGKFSINSAPGKGTEITLVFNAG